MMEASRRRKVDPRSYAWRVVRLLVLPYTLLQLESITADEIKKPLYDRNEYKFLELPNRLKAVVISVPDCDRAAACISVHAGAHQDPDDVAGTAHLLEHMLFLGSKKYPEPKEYFEFVWTNGGNTNAFTSASRTAFFLEISPNLLEQALDRMAHGFSAPLLQQQLVKNEIGAVHREFTYRKTHDSHRVHMLLSQVPRFPHLGKFTTGNFDTLLHGPQRKGIEPHEVMKQFHETWYSANLMTLAVAGKEPVEVLEAMVMRLFSGVPNFDKPAPVVPQCSVDYLPFPSSLLGTVTYVVPIADLHQAVFAFYIPPDRSMLDTKPDVFIKGLLEHNCPTCLAPKLKEEGMIRSLRVGISESESCSRIELVLNLTEKGSLDVARIGELVFLYIRHMALEPVEKWRWKEVHDLADLAFQYQDQQSPVDLVKTVAKNLFYYLPKEVLRGEKYTYMFDGQQIALILASMKPSNARVLLVDKKYKPRCTKVLSGYPVEYAEDTLPASTEQLWSKIENMSPTEIRESMKEENMSLPAPNQFIPTDLSVARPPRHAPRFPKLLRFTAGDLCTDTTCKIFFKQDVTFRMPKASVNLVLYLEPVNGYTCDAFFTRVLVACLALKLQKVMADAELAGYSFKVKAGVEKASTFLRHIVRPNGIVLTVTGYSDKLYQVLQKGVAFVGNSLATGSWKEVFPLAVESVRKQLRADVYARHPVRQASDALATLFMYPEVDDAGFVKYAEEHAITINALNSWIFEKGSRSKIAVEGLLQGNMTEAQAKVLVNYVSKWLTRAPSPYHEVCTYRVFDAHDAVAALQALPGHQNSPTRKELSQIRLRYTANNTLPVDEQTAVSLYIQMGWPSLQRQALIFLLSLWIRDKFFAELRTKQQLGYIVHFTTQTLEHMRYLLFTVTSTYDVLFVSERIEEFMKSHLNSPLSQEDFKIIQKAAIDLNQVKHKSLAEEVAFNFNQVVAREFMFDLKEQLCNVLKLLTVDDFNTFMREEVTKSPQTLIAIRAGDGGRRTKRLEDTLEINSTGQWDRIPKTKFATI